MVFSGLLHSWTGGVREGVWRRGSVRFSSCSLQAYKVTEQHRHSLHRLYKEKDMMTWYIHVCILHYIPCISLEYACTCIYMYSVHSTLNIQNIYYYYVHVYTCRKECSLYMYTCHQATALTRSTFTSVLRCCTCILQTLLDQCASMHVRLCACMYTKDGWGLSGIPVS